MVRLFEARLFTDPYECRTEQQTTPLSNNTESIQHQPPDFNPNEYGTDIRNINGLQMLALDPTSLFIDVSSACANNGRAGHKLPTESILDQIWTVVNSYPTTIRTPDRPLNLRSTDNLSLEPLSFLLQT